jgi:cytochrome c
MNRLFFALIGATVLHMPAYADQALAQQKNCLACHNIERKVVGPSFKDVAKKYASQDVSAKLASKIIKGGAGVWGAIPMPANAQVSEAEAQKLAAWILSLK